MKHASASLAILSMMLFSSCSKKEATDARVPAVDSPKPPAEASLPEQPASGPRGFVHLKDGTKVPGTIVASSKTDMVVAGDDGIERKIPLGQVKSVEYGDTEPAKSSRPPARASAPSPDSAPQRRAGAEGKPPETAPQQTSERGGMVPTDTRTPPPRAVTTKTFELPAGSEISVRTNEAINSETAAEGQTFDAQVTREAKDANGDVVIPRGSDARVVIKSASKGGRIRGASDLVLDLQSVRINGTQHEIDTVDITKQGKSGVGANKRTAEYAGGGAAVGAIIGAIAGGGKGAAIGAGAGAGAGALTQVLTKGRAIKVPAESVLTFSLDKALKVVRRE